MSRADTERWKGLVALVVDAVTHGSEAVERIQKETVGRPLALLEKVPAVSGPAKVVHVLHDTSVGLTHGTIRLVARATREAASFALDLSAQPTDRTGEAPRPDTRK